MTHPYKHKLLVFALFLITYLIAGAIEDSPDIGTAIFAAAASTMLTFAYLPSLYVEIIGGDNETDC